MGARLRQSIMGVGLLFKLFQHVLHTLYMGDAYIYIVNCYSSFTICATEYNFGWY